MADVDEPRERLEASRDRVGRRVAYDAAYECAGKICVANSPSHSAGWHGVFAAPSLYVTLYCSAFVLCLGDGGELSSSSVFLQLLCRRSSLTLHTRSFRSLAEPHVTGRADAPDAGPQLLVHHTGDRVRLVHATAHRH